VARTKIEDTISVGLRLPVDLVRRADAFAARLMRENPGMRYTRTDAIRIILARHLPEDEMAAAPSADPKPSKRVGRR
jgi:hypothetical protein